MKNRILVIDDDNINCNLLAELLEVQYEIILAKNGYDGLSILSYQLGKIRAILLDLQMPIMNGYSFLCEYNSRGWNKLVPIVVVSSDYGDETKKRLDSLGVKYFISKPYKFDSARDVINKAIEDFYSAEG